MARRQPLLECAAPRDPDRTPDEVEASQEVEDASCASSAQMREGSSTWTAQGLGGRAAGLPLAARVSGGLSRPSGLRGGRRQPALGRGNGRGARLLRALPTGPSRAWPKGERRGARGARLEATRPDLAALLKAELERAPRTDLLRGRPGYEGGAEIPTSTSSSASVTGVSCAKAAAWRSFCRAARSRRKARRTSALALRAHDGRRLDFLVNRGRWAFDAEPRYTSPSRSRARIRRPTDHRSRSLVSPDSQRRLRRAVGRRLGIALATRALGPAARGAASAVTGSSGPAAPSFGSGPASPRAATAGRASRSVSSTRPTTRALARRDRRSPALEGRELRPVTHPLGRRRVRARRAPRHLRKQRKPRPATGRGRGAGGCRRSVRRPSQADSLVRASPSRCLARDRLEDGAVGTLCPPRHLPHE